MCGAEVVPYLSEAAFECGDTAFSSNFADDMDFIVDSGASINIMSTKSNHLLSNSQQGTARISGFASTISSRADRKGIIHLYFYNPTQPDGGTNLGIDVSTVPDANHNLLSVSHMCKQLGFTCTFAPLGEPEGFSRLEPDGTKTYIPITYYPKRKLWIVHFTAGLSATDARAKAISRQHTICAACSAFDWNDEDYIGAAETPADDDQFDDDLPDPVPEYPSDRIYDDTEASVVPSQRPKDRAMEHRIRHRKLGHMGPCPGGCDVCKMTQGKLRSVFSIASPTHDIKPGRTFHMDGKPWDVTSRHGNNNTIISRCDASGYFIPPIHIDLRSESLDAIIAAIRAARRDPDIGNNTIVERIITDPAGEWGWTSGAKARLSAEVNVELVLRPTQSDKRLNARGEANIKILVRQAQRIQLDMRLEKDRWEETINYAAHTRNLTCMVRDASPTGHGIRPIEAVSHNKISRDVCEQRLEAAQPPGTLCYVHEVGKHGGARDPSHARYGVVVRMEQDVAVFESIRRDGKSITEFRSKNFKPITLRPGVSAKQFVGIPVDHDALSRACFPTINSDAGPTIIELSDLDDETAARLPMVSGIDTGKCPEMPNIVTVDMSGRVWRPSGDGQYLHPTDDYNYTIAANSRSTETPQARIDRLMDDLHHRPNMFDGAIIHKLYPDVGIVFRGRVLQFNAHRQYWRVKYDVDDTESDFDVNDMEQYAIRYKDGKSNPDGGRSAFARYKKLLIHPPTPASDGQPAPGDASNPGDVTAPGDGKPQGPVTSKVTFEDISKWTSKDHYTTTNDQTFEDICKDLNLQSNEKLIYWNFLKQHNMGNDKKRAKDPDYTFFPNPVDRRKTKGVTKFNAGQKFPIPSGRLWDRMSLPAAAASAIIDKSLPAGEDLANFECRQAAIGEYVNHKCMISVTDNTVYSERLFHQAGLQMDAAESGLIVNWAEMEMDHPDATRIFTTDELGLTVNWSNMEQLNKKDIAEGRPETPRNMKHIFGRYDAAGWDEAAQIEWDGLNKMNTFEHGVSYAELRRRGIVPGKNIVDMKMLLTLKRKPDNTIDKMKGRNVACGHKGAIPKSSLSSVFSAAPDLAASRLLDCLGTMFNMHRFAMDIKQAYLRGTAGDDDQFPVRYPVGEIRDHYTVNGVEHFGIIKGNLYGLPLSARRFGEHRNMVIIEMMKEHNPSWEIRQCTKEPCYFIVHIVKLTWLCAHSDDIAGWSMDPVEAELITVQLGVLFGDADGKSGIEIVDPKHMLGVQKERASADGVHTMKLTQPGFIDNLWDKFGGFRGKLNAPDQPFPDDTKHPVLGRDGKCIDVTDKEAKDVLDGGMRELIGSTLWASRNTSPTTSYAMAILSRCLQHPSRNSWEAALHTLHYMKDNRDVGITYRSSENFEPVVFFDSSHGQDRHTGKSQFGWVLMMGGAVINWKSKKHTVSALSTSEAEYMAATPAYRAAHHLRLLLTEMGFGFLVQEPTLMINDNRNAVTWSNEEMITDGNRHVLPGFHRVNDAVDERICKIVHDSGDHNGADLMTKPVTAAVEAELSQVITGNKRMTIPESEATQFWSRQDSIRALGTSMINLPPPKPPLELGLPSSLSDDSWECGKLIYDTW